MLFLQRLCHVIWCDFRTITSILPLTSRRRKTSFGGPKMNLESYVTVILQKHFVKIEDKTYLYYFYMFGNVCAFAIACPSPGVVPLHLQPTRHHWSTFAWSNGGTKLWHVSTTHQKYTKNKKIPSFLKSDQKISWISSTVSTVYLSYIGNVASCIGSGIPWNFCGWDHWTLRLHHGGQGGNNKLPLQFVFAKTLVNSVRLQYI